VRRLSSDAHLLDVVDLHDFDRIVTFLTPEWGRKRGVAKGSRRKFSRFAGQLQLLSRVAVCWFEKDNRDLVRIESVELIRPPGAFFESLEGILAGSYMAEHLVQFSQENEDSELYSRLLESTLLALAEGVDLDLALRYFETWVLRIAGVFPVPIECPECGRDPAALGAILPAHGEGIVCRECASGSSGSPVSLTALHFFRESSGRKLTELHAQPPDMATLREVETVCRTVRRCFLDHELRSYGVMQTTLGTSSPLSGVS